MSTLQTPATVPRGRLRLGLAVETVTIKSDTGASRLLPQPEVAARYGLTGDLDAGLKLYPIGGELGVKYQVVHGTLDLAIAPAVDYFPNADAFSSSPASRTPGDVPANPPFGLVHLHLPLLFGWNASECVTIGFGPKFLYAISSSETAPSLHNAAARAGALFGGFVSLPVRIEEGFWIVPELNVYEPVAGGGPVWQGGFAFLIGGPTGGVDR